MTNVKERAIQVGNSVLVYMKPGDVPIEAWIKTIDEITDIIIEVVVKDGPLKDTVLQVEDKIVLFANSSLDILKQSDLTWKQRLRMVWKRFISTIKIG